MDHSCAEGRGAGLGPLGCGGWVSPQWEILYAHSQALAPGQVCGFCQVPILRPTPGSGGGTHHSTCKIASLVTEQPGSQATGNKPVSPPYLAQVSPLSSTAPALLPGPSPSPQTPAGRGPCCGPGTCHEEGSVAHGGGAPSGSPSLRADLHSRLWRTHVWTDSQHVPRLGSWFRAFVKPK